jgi:hypothetical protein
MTVPYKPSDLIYQRMLSKAQKNAETGCWEFMGKRLRDGYGLVSVDGKWHRAHRIAYGYHNTGSPLVVRHLCHNPPCVNPAHLAAGTPKDNAMDRKNAGRGGNLKGTNNGRSVLTEADVLFIRASSESGPVLAATFGVTRTAICSIRRRRIWTHI